MKKISTKNWERYKESEQGKATIAEFAKLYNENVPIEDILQLCKKYDSQYFTNISEREETAYCLEALNDFDSIIGDAKDAYRFEDEEDTAIFYVEEVLHGVIDPSLINDEGLAPQQVYKSLLSANMFISTMLYCYMPERYLPNLWVMQYKYFRLMAKKYDIQLSEEPLRSEYLNRNTYYLAVSNAMFNFCNFNGITEPAEICAFFYDYELELIKEELEEENSIQELPEPAQAWFLVGNYGEIERTIETGFWQANAETKRGDILVFYEKSPVMAINAIYRAKEDGVIDPFFFYYSNTYICNKIDMPPISFKELQEHPYFKDHKLVRKNFQGGSGWTLNSDDYKQLCKIWECKNYNVTTLPKLKAHEVPKDIDYTEKEAAVHKYQVLPLLKDMGWTEENGDILNQVVLHLGRGEAGKIARTDISLHPYGENNKNAKVLIEEKFRMKNEAEVTEAFEQGKSYAKQQLANVCVVCDKAQIRVYKKQKDGDFRPDKYQVFYWDEMPNPDKFNELKKLLS